MFADYAIRASAAATLAAGALWLASPERPVTPLNDTLLASIAGLDQGSHAYTTNCAYTSLGTNEVAWRDCNGNNGKGCVHCAGGNFTSTGGLSTQPKVRDTGNDVPCASSGISKESGSCINNECVFQGDPVEGGCTGTPDAYGPQPIKP